MNCSPLPHLDARNIDPEETRGWFERGDDIAHWLAARYVMRTDRFGLYKHTTGDDGSEEVSTLTAPWHGAKRDTLTHRRLLDSIVSAGKLSKQQARVDGKTVRIGATVGAHCSSPDDLGKRVRVDLDAHASDSQPDDALRNHRFALDCAERARSWGLTPLLWDSDGRGGLWLELLFTEPVPTPFLFELARELIAGWESFGFREKPETFPKQERVSTTAKKCGNWARLPGLHHKRPHWSRLWDFATGTWLIGAAAVAAMLAHAGDGPSVVKGLRSKLLLIGSPKPVDPPQVIEAPKASPARVAPGSGAIGGTDDDAMKVKALRAYAKAAGAKGTGGRNNVAYTIAANGLKDKELSAAVVYEVLAEWNRNNTPPLDSHELDQIIRNAANYGKGGKRWESRPKKITGANRPQVPSAACDAANTPPKAEESRDGLILIKKEDTQDKSVARCWEERKPRRYCERGKRFLGEGCHEDTWGSVAGFRPSCGCWWHDPCFHNKRLDLIESLCPLIVIRCAPVAVWRGTAKEWGVLLSHLRRRAEKDGAQGPMFHITVAPRRGGPLCAFVFDPPTSPRLGAARVPAAEAADLLAAEINGIEQPAREDNERFRPVNVSPGLIPEDESRFYYELNGERVPKGTPGAKKKKVRLFTVRSRDVYHPPSICTAILAAAGATETIAHICDDVKGSDGKAIRDFSGRNWDKVPRSRQHDAVEKIAGRLVLSRPVPSADEADSEDGPLAMDYRIIGLADLDDELEAPGPTAKATNPIVEPPRETASTPVPPAPVPPGADKNSVVNPELERVLAEILAFVARGPSAHRAAVVNLCQDARVMGSVEHARMLLARVKALGQGF